MDDAPLPAWLEGAPGAWRLRIAAQPGAPRTEVVGEFERGEAVALLDPDGREIARGLSGYSSSEARLIMRKPSSEIARILGFVEEPELVHRDHMVLRVAPGSDGDDAAKTADASNSPNSPSASS
jgi:hypothetical protein